MTIKELLDKVDLEQPHLTPCKTKSKEDLQQQSPQPHTAYLGPKLYKEDDFFVMNLDEFLEENDLLSQQKTVKGEKNSPEPEELPRASPHSVIGPHNLVVPLPRPGVIVSSKNRNQLPRGENEFLYSESKRARLEREKEERRRKLEIEIEFAPEDLALATVPGADFDPKQRAFEAEELRPQPIIRKRPKLFVPDDCKDINYWDKRTKNNIAARRSREARRLKENQIALRAAFLEKENAALRKELEDTQFLNSKINTERDILKMKLSKYEAFAH